MKLITRKIAENLIRTSNPIQSTIDQSSESLKVIFTFPNGKSLVVNYDNHIQEKSYYLIDKN